MDITHFYPLHDGNIGDIEQSKIHPRRLGSAHPRNAPYQAFKAKDEYFVLAAGNDKLWQEVCVAVGKPELVDDQRFRSQILRAQNQAALVEIIGSCFLDKTAAEWLEEMDARGVPCAPINDYRQILADPQLETMQLVRPLRLPNGVDTRTTAFPVAMTGYRFEIYRAPPQLGEHNAQVLAEWLKSG